MLLCCHAARARTCWSAALRLHMMWWIGGLVTCVTAAGECSDSCISQSEIPRLETPTFLQSVSDRHVLGHDNCTASQMLIEARPFSLVSEDLVRCGANEGGLPVNAAFHNSYIQNLKQIFPDVHVLWDTPSASDAAQWKEPIAVVEEGLFRLVENSTHWFNIATMEIPALIRFVLAPLKAANRLNPRIVLPWEGNSDGGNLGVLRDVFSSTQLSFVGGLPSCSHWSSCTNATKVQLQNVDVGTLLFIPEVYPIGHPRAPCAKLDIASVRDWFLEKRPTTASSNGQLLAEVAQLPEGPNQVTLIDRESHPVTFYPPELSLGEVGAAIVDQTTAVHGGSTQRNGAQGSGEDKQEGPYVYERPFVTIPNMDEVAAHLERWSTAHGMTFRRVMFETMPFAEQLATVQSTRVLVGMEGAGLANMVFLEVPAKSAVVELNAANGKVESWQEFPSIANYLGVPLWMHVFRCDFVNPNVGVDTSALNATMDEVWRHFHL